MGPLHGSSSTLPAIAGFEPSPVRATACQQAGLDVRCEFFTKDTAIPAADVIVFDNVIEHVMEPKTLIRDALTKLRPQGLLIIIVPSLHDLRYYLRPDLRQKHLWIPKYHINYFTPRTLHLLYQIHGLRSQSFGLETACRATLWMLPKLILDRIGLYTSGLYFFGIKQP